MSGLIELTSYEIELNNLPKHNPEQGYFIFRGLSDRNNSGFIGLHWTEIPHLAYGHSDRGRGALFVAHLSLEELVERGHPVFQYQMPRGLSDQGPSGVELISNPSNVRLVVRVEKTELFQRVPLEIVDEYGWSGRIDWRRLSRDVFASSFKT